MRKFRYIAFDRSGNDAKGLHEARTFELALDELNGKGFKVINLVEKKESILRRDLQIGPSRVQSVHFIVFCRQLAVLYTTGISLIDAIRILAEQTESKVFKKILLGVAEEMKSGTLFSTAAAHHPKVFSEIFLNMVKAGEASGNLDDMLNRLAIFYEKEHYTREKVKSALAYPMIMAVVTALVVVILMTFVVPKFVENFADFGIELPLPTKIVIGISDWMKQFWYVVPLILISPVILYRMIVRSPKGRFRMDVIKLKLPVFGKLWHKQAISRFSRTFCSLYAAALPMLEVLTIVSEVVGNEAIAKLIRKSREGVRSGDAIAKPLVGTWLFPPMVVQMLAVGERTGALDTMLEKVADFYEADVDQMADRLKSLLEPIMILILAGVVGLIVLAVLMPSFALIGGMN